MIKLNVHPYPSNVWFTTDHDEFMRKRKSICDMCSPVFAEGCVSTDDSGRNQVIGIFNVTHNTIAHEVGHVVMNLFQYIGMPITDDTQEAFCYLTGKIHEQIYRYLNKYSIEVSK